MCHFVIAANREILKKDLMEILTGQSSVFGPVCVGLPRDSCLELEVPLI